MESDITNKLDMKLGHIWTDGCLGSAGWSRIIGGGDEHENEERMGSLTSYGGLDWTDRADACLLFIHLSGFLTHPGIEHIFNIYIKIEAL